MLRRVLLAAVAVSALSFVGCTPTYPKCEKDEHCKTDGHNEVCVNGACQECGKDPDCKTGFVCRDTKCQPAPECTADSHCQPGFKCKAEKCVSECTADADCSANMQCKAGRCIPAECASDSDCASGKKCDESRRCVEPVVEAKACNLVTVRFDFNESNLTDDARRQLDRNADCIKSKRGTITLAGHADERGTEEYNLHLGERRAASVKKYLTALGVDASSLKTTSYGEERPSNPGHNEGAWSENRRVEFGQ